MAPKLSLCAESTATASEVTICLQVVCKSGTQDPVIWTALITHLLAFWQARGYATGKGGLRPVTLLLLVSGRGNQRQRERRFGLAVRRSRRAAARFRFGSPFSSKTAVVCGHCLVTLSSQWNIKMALIAAHLMQESFWWWQCSDIYGGGRLYIYIYSSPHHTTPPPLLPVFTKGLRVSVDVKHHVYFTKREGGGGGEIIDVNNWFCGAITLVTTLGILSG